MNVIEEWREVPGFPMYEVSQLGRVRRKPVVLSGGTIPSGHLTVALSKGRGKGKPQSMYIHRLVALAFIPNSDPTTRTLVNHINSDPADNRVENLEWATYSENIAHGWRKNGRRCSAEVRVMAIDEGGEIFASFRSYADAAKLLGVSPSAIRTAAERKGTSCGYRWVRYDSK
jgi:hypothetical protein